MMISYDSKRAIAVMRECDTSYFVKMYCLESYKETFSEQFGVSPPEKEKNIEASGDKEVHDIAQYCFKEQAQAGATEGGGGQEGQTKSQKWL